MKKIKILSKYLNILSNKRGATIVEYVLIAVLLVLVIIATVLLLQENSSILFNSVGEQVGNFSNLPTSS